MATNTLGGAAAEALREVSALYRTTAELAKAELSRTGVNLGLGLALITGAVAAVAGIVPLLVLAFVWGLVALGIWPWAAYLIAAGVVLLAGAGLAVAGRSLLKRATAAVGRATALIKGSLDALKAEGDPADAGDPAASDTPGPDRPPEG
ncbi:MAG: phage holin family protein [Bifidobacteriaceae bacterium]|jgi:hypothetical protein|nr:phage holin family protein [Bifidobacteriaceae bacterium]